MPERQLLSGWGLTRPTSAQVRRPAAPTVEHVQELITGADSRGILARGLGRSYGDAAQNAGGTVLSLRSADSSQPLAGVHGPISAEGVIRVSAGVSVEEILVWSVPQGWFIPVTPGTRYATVGGLIGTDVHGKNHHRHGSIGQHIREMTLVSGTGDVLKLTAADPRFWATIGGMGLTGVVVEATIAMLPVESDRILVSTRRPADFDSLLRALEEADRHTYSVAWVDMSARGRHFGRGIVSSGEHAAADASTPQSERPGTEQPRRGPRVGVPVTPPFSAVNPASVRAFNEAWFRLAPKSRTDENQHYRTFFHPLDGVAGWNRLYGTRGFLQYQCVVPTEHSTVLIGILERLQRAGAPSFLTVLKRFGAQSEAPLSFPMPGWTLTVDIPMGVSGLDPVLRACDDMVASCGGRLYLAKDSRMSPDMLASTYPRLPRWREQRDRMDPKRVMRSDLGRRLAL